MSELGEVFKALKEHNREQRAIRREAGIADILALRALGYRVKEVTEFQYRINGRLDLYPTNRRWHDIRQSQRGRYSSALAITRKVLG